VRIRFRRMRPGAMVPTRQTEGSVGYDLHFCPADGKPVTIPSVWTSVFCCVAGMVPTLIDMRHSIEVIGQVRKYWLDRLKVGSTLLSTGIAVAIPPGYEGQVRSRSGLSYKHSLLLICGAGTIDQDYRGEICVPLLNLGPVPVVLQPGERIAQVIIAPVLTPEWVEADLDDTARGKGGFGSTGM